ncbi:MAG: 50S ribosomal protein L2 [bacterium]|nr:50S ribosomal protein L2 [bacterium]
MPIKRYKATTPGRRGSSVITTDDLSRSRPPKRLRTTIKKTGGRNRQGRVTVRHRGGGHKKFYRIIDFNRSRFDELAKVISLEYDPNRTARIALIEYTDGAKSYIIAPDTLKSGDTVISSRQKVEIKPGNRMPLEFIPVGIPVFNVELQPGGKGRIARSAGSAVFVQSVEGKFAQLKLPSGEIRLFPKDCQATVGSASNLDHKNIRLGKAGRMRWLGVRPTVRGKAMNPVDHPHGGGEGRSPIGMKHPKTPWGKPALGVKTRRRKPSDRLILRGRKRKR